METGEREDIDEMAFIDFCIVHQYMTVLTDEQAIEVEKQVKKKPKPKKKKITDTDTYLDTDTNEENET